MGVLNKFRIIWKLLVFSLKLPKMANSTSIDIFCLQSLITSKKTTSTNQLQRLILGGIKRHLAEQEIIEIEGISFDSCKLFNLK